MKASEIAHTGAKLTWTASKDNVEVAGYNVYLNDEKVNEELITGTEYDLADLTANTEYNVTVTAVDAAGMSLKIRSSDIYNTEGSRPYRTYSNDC